MKALRSLYVTILILALEVLFIEVPLYITICTRPMGYILELQARSSIGHARSIGSLIRTLETSH